MRGGWARSTVCAAMLLTAAAAGQADPAAAQSARAADRQVGEASWYGPGFHGRETASGERYDQNAMTAAHRRLPLGSVVKVRNLENGREVTVEINDRGPYAKGRVIDLSRAAARRLDMVEDGVARVQVQVVRRADDERVADARDDGGDGDVPTP